MIIRQHSSEESVRTGPSVSVRVRAVVSASLSFTVLHLTNKTGSYLKFVYHSLLESRANLYGANRRVQKKQTKFVYILRCCSKVTL